MRFICETCGEPFDRPILRGPTARYCKRKCYPSEQNRTYRPRRICPSCGKPCQGRLCRECWLRSRPPAHNRIPTEALLVALRAYYEKHGDSPSATEFQGPKGLKPNLGTFQKRFGSWNAALKVAGLPTRRPGEGRPQKREDRSRHDRNRRMVTAGAMGGGSAKRLDAGGPPKKSHYRQDRPR